MARKVRKRLEVPDGGTAGQQAAEGIGAEPAQQLGPGPPQEQALGEGAPPARSDSTEAAVAAQAALLQPRLDGSGLLASGQLLSGALSAALGSFKIPTLPQHLQPSALQPPQQPFRRDALQQQQQQQQEQAQQDMQHPHAAQEQQQQQQQTFVQPPVALPAPGAPIAPPHALPAAGSAQLQGSPSGGLPTSLSGGTLSLAATGGGPLSGPMPSEPGSRQDMWLLAHAYSSMTAEQKEKLAAQPQEVRTFVLRARMRKVREQLEALQAGATAGVMPAGLALPPRGAGPSSGGTPAPAGSEGRPQPTPFATEAAQRGSPSLLELAAGEALRRRASLGLQQAAALQAAAAAAQQQQQQQQLGGLSLAAAPMPPYWPPGLGSPHPVHPQQQQQQQQQYSEGMARQPSSPLVPIGDLGGGGASTGLPGGAEMPPFAAMSETERLLHLRRLKRQQEEWLERQRQAAAALHGGGNDGGGLQHTAVQDGRR
jgi:type II secretory pathway pseudopilin PulG